MIDVQNLRFRYPGARHDALIDVSWRAGRGEYILVAGQSGSGKSTLLRCLNGLIPHFHGGYFAGDVVIDGQNTRLSPPRELATTVGTVFQDPEAQLVTDTAEDEIAFTLENLGYRRQPIATRSEEICRELGISHLLTRRVSTLSGGERQLVALAAALAPEPAVVVLDEPTSQLDSANAAAVIGTLAHQNREHGLTVVLAEHRLGRLVGEAGSLLLLSHGSASALTPANAGHVLMSHDLLPAVGDLYGSDDIASPGDELAKVHDLEFSYGPRAVLREVDLTVREGEALALTGSNGSGKTTLLKQLIGLLRPARGRVTLKGCDIRDRSVQNIARFVGYVPQQPTLMLHQETAGNELQFTLDALGRSGSVADELRMMELGHFGRAHPLDLSGGERQRLAIAAITIARPSLLLLDEPTRGLPWSMKRNLAGMLRGYAADGRAVVVATHDEDFVRAFASRRITLSGGQIWQDEPCTGQNQSPMDQNKDDIPLLTAAKLD